MELNACAQCGFTTTNFFEFTSHIEQHECEMNNDVKEATEEKRWEDQSPSPSPPYSPISAEDAKDFPKTPSPPKIDEDAEVSTVIKSSFSSPESTPSAKSAKRTHTCPFCNFTTCMSQHMKSHLEAHERHQGQMYQCDICQMQFSQKANMHRHRMRHSGVKPYECRFCKKRFFRKDQMQEHSMTHIKTGFGFDCPVANCEMQFCQHAMLRSHLDEKHNITPSSQASCKRCSLLFANARRLLLHYQTRHDESEGAALSPSAKKEPSAKRRRLNTGAPVAVHSPQPILSEQLQQITKKELSPPNTDSSDNSSSPEYEEQFQTTNYPITSQDLLMMCLTGAAMHTEPTKSSASASPTVSKAASAEPEPNTPIWPEASSAMSCGSASATSPINVSFSPSNESTSRASLISEENKAPSPPAPTDGKECSHCGIVFFDNTMYLLHKGLHSEKNPWRCSLCGLDCGEKYMFTTHTIFADHSKCTEIHQTTGPLLAN
ncbi:unnamed protein product [Caenorhabditis auriculariae]|uniref:C2H2-type domain-containing protein n=1 Tax=Caenorhabditis auriculariae TaxID=2777116 RepID=A0A8S1GNE4_9PELO|nr:unnamed protein product [Caenorhabditis auriculariae]